MTLGSTELWGADETQIKQSNQKSIQRLFLHLPYLEIFLYILFLKRYFILRWNP